MDDEREAVLAQLALDVQTLSRTSDAQLEQTLRVLHLIAAANTTGSNVKLALCVSQGEGRGIIGINADEFDIAAIMHDCMELVDAHTIADAPPKNLWS